jgi:hypothetical protein
MAGWEAAKAEDLSLHLRSKNISKRGPQNCRSLGFARDDKERVVARWQVVAALKVMKGPSPSNTFSFVIPSEAEGSAVLRTLPGYVFSPRLT